METVGSGSAVAAEVLGVQTNAGRRNRAAAERWSDVFFTLGKVEGVDVLR